MDHRWISEDPAGFVDGPNRYAYVRNSPIRLFDPDGRQAQALPIIVICSPDPITKGALIAAGIASAVIIYQACKDGNCFGDNDEKKRERNTCQPLLNLCLENPGRVTSETNMLGTFLYTYDGVSGCVATVTYPNSQTSTYAYFGNTGDHRLQTIHHTYPNATPLSRFDYTYDVAGNILTWQADSTAVLWEYGYDVADQLTLAVRSPRIRRRQPFEIHIR